MPDFDVYHEIFVVYTVYLTGMGSCGVLEKNTVSSILKLELRKVPKNERLY